MSPKLSFLPFLSACFPVALFLLGFQGIDEVLFKWRNFLALIISHDKNILHHKTVHRTGKRCSVIQFILEVLGKYPE
jgi:hypothetical protein